MSAEHFHTLEYQFRLAGGGIKEFRIRLREPELQLVDETRGALPEWTRLEHHQCANCPLSKDLHPHCPVAAGMAGVIEAFRDCLSTERAEIVIRGETREYRREASLQYGVSSLMGLHMVTSGCPIMDKLRPMVRTHLPFANIEETTYRLTSMYLLAQFFVQQHGGEGDWELRRLVDLCDAVGQVNQGFSRRLLSINPRDASLNGLASLDCFTMSAAFAVDRERLSELEAVFRPYWEAVKAEGERIRCWGWCRKWVGVEVGVEVKVVDEGWEAVWGERGNSHGGIPRSRKGAKLAKGRYGLAFAGFAGFAEEWPGGDLSCLRGHGIP